MAKTPTPKRVRRPVLLAIAGDSAAGKTTLTEGLAEALGKDRCVSICVDDYHRYDRQERKCLPFTALHPDCNYVEIMEQHLQLLATGRPILKPVYDHGTGLLARCLQHETDHLHGIVFGDRLSGRARKKLYALHEDAADLYPADWPVTPRADSA